ncbi:twin-arginine translocase subunit TatC [Alicyclobacillaceae bacterium I2511]|nr:twin-arginine translocase subunit TatC [Alicyclobacillaceae bacterium I2511]
MSVEQLVAHLEELRRRFIWVLLFFVITFIVALLFVNRIYGVLEAPMGSQKLVILGPAEVVHVYFALAGMSALSITLPFAVWQLWLYVRPALRQTEQRIIRAYVVPTIIMFFLGVSFGYFVIFPLVFEFLMKLAKINFIPMITASEYVKFLLNLILPIGIMFELPVVILILSRLGIVTPKLLVRARKYAYFILIIIASMLSPPELVSHLSVAVPLILLYEVSVTLSKLVERRKNIRNREKT